MNRIEKQQGILLKLICKYPNDRQIFNLYKQNFIQLLILEKNGK